MARKIFLPFLCLSFFLGESLAFGSPNRSGTAGESSLAVSPERKRYSLRLLLKNQRKQAGGVTKISKGGLSERKPLSYLGNRCCIFCRISFMGLGVAPKKKIITLKETPAEKTIISGPASKLSEEENLEKLFLKEVEAAGSWPELAKELTNFVERELIKQTP
ncbi:MAG: hypothetical protein ACRCYP_06675 [Alphaproteobacteria bacterium]